MPRWWVLVVVAHVGPSLALASDGYRAVLVLWYLTWRRVVDWTAAGHIGSLFRGPRSSKMVMCLYGSV